MEVESWESIDGSMTGWEAGEDCSSGSLRLAKVEKARVPLGLVLAVGLFVFASSFKT